MTESTLFWIATKLFSQEFEKLNDLHEFISKYHWYRLIHLTQWCQYILIKMVVAYWNEKSLKIIFSDVFFQNIKEWMNAISVGHLFAHILEYSIHLWSLVDDDDVNYDRRQSSTRSFLTRHNLMISITLSYSTIIIHSFSFLFFFFDHHHLHPQQQHNIFSITKIYFSNLVSHFFLVFFSWSFPLCKQESNQC